MGSSVSGYPVRDTWVRVVRGVEVGAMAGGFFITDDRPINSLGYTPTAEEIESEEVICVLSDDQIVRVIEHCRVTCGDLMGRSSGVSYGYLDSKPGTPGLYQLLVGLRAAIKAEAESRLSNKRKYKHFLLITESLGYECMTDPDFAAEVIRKGLPEWLKELT